MNACDREAQLLLISGWARRGPGGWAVYDPAPGDGSAWAAASAADVAALEATLASCPRIAVAHAAIESQADGHRGGCAALLYNPCDCRGAVAVDDEP